MSTGKLAARATEGAGPQRRAFALAGSEMRSVPDGTGSETLRFTGYACVTERAYSVYDAAGEFPETIRAGAFASTLARNPDVPLLLNHDGMTLARTKSGTLTLTEDSTGLLTEARLDPKNNIVQNIRSAMERGDLDEMSFAFRVTQPGGGWNDDYTERKITAVDIHKGDVSLVTFGANPHTAGASMRSVERFLASLTPEQAAVARRRLGSITAGLPLDLAQTLTRLEYLRGGSTGRHGRKPPAPMDEQTRRAIAWVLRQQARPTGKH